MSYDEKAQLQEIRDAVFFEAAYDGDEDDWADEPPQAEAFYNPGDAIRLNEVLHGEYPLDPSHHGGEFRELLETMVEELGPKRSVFYPAFSKQSNTYISVGKSVGRTLGLDVIELSADGSCSTLSCLL
jgi:hypothetical protein